MRERNKIFYAEANYGQSEINAVLKVLVNQKHYLMGGKQTLKLEKEVSNLINVIVMNSLDWFAQLV